MIDYRVTLKNGMEYTYAALDYYGTDPNQFMGLVNTLNVSRRGSKEVFCVSTYAKQDRCRHKWDMVEQCGHMCVCQEDVCLRCGMVSVTGLLWEHPF